MNSKQANASKVNSSQTSPDQTDSSQTSSDQKSYSQTNSKQTNSNQLDPSQTNSKQAIYKLRFHELALKEWHKLGATVREQFKKKLAERLENPHIPSSMLNSMPNCYKIKLRTAGYRLVYRVDEDVIYVTVIAVGKREKLEVYNKASSRLD